MKARPEPARHGSVVDLVAIAAELSLDAAAAELGHAARTILREADLRVVVIALRAGATIAEHHAQDTATLQVLQGTVQVGLPGRVVELGVGQLLPLARGVVHDVAAGAPAAIVLTLARAGA